MVQKAIRMPASFSVDEAAQFREQTREMIQQEAIIFELDFASCNFIDSTGLGVIVSLYKRCKEMGGNVVLKNLNGDVSRIFQMTRLDRVFNIK